MLPLPRQIEPDGLLRYGVETDCGAWRLWYRRQADKRALVSAFLAAKPTTRLENCNDGNRIRYPASPEFGSLFTGLLVVHQGIDETSEENAGKSRR